MYVHHPVLIVAEGIKFIFETETSHFYVDRRHTVNWPTSANWDKWKNSDQEGQPNIQVRVLSVVTTDKQRNFQYEDRALEDQLTFNRGEFNFSNYYDRPVTPNRPTIIKAMGKDALVTYDVWVDGVLDGTWTATVQPCIQGIILSFEDDVISIRTPDFFGGATIQMKLQESVSSNGWYLGEWALKDAAAWMYDWCTGSDEHKMQLLWRSQRHEAPAEPDLKGLHKHKALIGVLRQDPLMDDFLRRFCSSKSSAKIVANRLLGTFFEHVQGDVEEIKKAIFKVSLPQRAPAYKGEVNHDILKALPGALGLLAETEKKLDWKKRDTLREQAEGLLEGQAPKLFDAIVNGDILAMRKLSKEKKLGRSNSLHSSRTEVTLLGERLSQNRSVHKIALLGGRNGVRTNGHLVRLGHSHDVLALGDKFLFEEVRNVLRQKDDGPALGCSASASSQRCGLVDAPLNGFRPICRDLLLALAVGAGLRIVESALLVWNLDGTCADTIWTTDQIPRRSAGKARKDGLSLRRTCGEGRSKVDEAGTVGSGQGTGHDSSQGLKDTHYAR